VIRLLVDTDLCIDMIRGRPRAVTAVQRIRRRSPGSVGISAITLAEFEFAVATGNRKEFDRVPGLGLADWP